jgi:hypothetical protein
VGVNRLTGFQGAFTALDPLNDSLPQAFYDKWDDSTFIDNLEDSVLFTEIEKRCVKYWNMLSEIIESTPTHQSNDLNWAVKRWSSNFLLHFGALAEGRTAWQVELDEFIGVIKTIMKPIEERDGEERRHIRELDNQLEALISTSPNSSSSRDNVKLRDNVILSGRWVADKLRPKVDTKHQSRSLSLTVKFQGGEKASLSAKAFLWLKKHLHHKLLIQCFPGELLIGIEDARIRAASRGDEAYAFYNDDVELIVSTDKEEILKILRFDGDVHVE